jgi:4-hydroxybenzoate polyprenyltransferase
MPLFRRKTQTGFELLIHATGYGALTLHAGSAAMSRPVEPPIVNVTLGFFFLFAGFYPLIQIYQMAEDRDCGDVTLALRLGKQKSLQFAGAAVLAAFAFTLDEVWLRFRDLGAVLLLIALGLWGVVLAPWVLRHDQVDRAFEQRGSHQALWLWSSTDLSMVWAMALA